MKQKVGKYGKPALYTRNQFKQDLKEIIMEKCPEIIFTAYKIFLRFQIDNQLRRITNI